MFMDVLVALLLQLSQPASPKSLFPIKVHVTFTVDLGDQSYATYRQRLLKASRADDPLELTFKESSPLFADRVGEANAYYRLSFPPQLRIFLIRNPTNKLPVEDLTPDMSLFLKNTAADPPVAAGEKPIIRPPVDKTYSVSRDGVVSLDVPTETWSKADYTNGAIVSDRHLLGAQLTLAMSRGFALRVISLEFAGKEIRLRPDDFRHSTDRHDSPIYTMTLPSTPEGFLRLIVR
jgi:hypothetical protein